MKLFTCITFHFRADKLAYLQHVLSWQPRLAPSVQVALITNTVVEDELAAIAAVLPPPTDAFQCQIFNHGPQPLPSPWLLTWLHKPLMLKKYQDDPGTTHFMYLEDDHEITPTNIAYWLEGREQLRPFGLYPSFLQVEWSASQQEWTSVALFNDEQVSIARSPRLTTHDERAHYINLSKVYQGMFLYDRELMGEHIAAVSFDYSRYVPDLEARFASSWGGGIAEAATDGLTFVNVPAGCHSRNFVPYFPKYRLLDPRCFVHHLPDKYANTPDSPFGHLPVRQILCP